MSRKANRGNRCPHCYMKNSLCICEFLLQIETQTLVTVLMHKRETYTTTNTARIATSILKNSEILLRGVQEEPLLQERVFRSHYTPILLYPSEKSTPLKKEIFKGQKIQLIVPDGSWRQTRKFSKREPYLDKIPHVHLEPSKPSLFFLRRKIKPDGVSTMEAIARALGILESPTVQEKLEEVFLIHIERTLKSRGQKLSDKMAYHT